MKQETPNNSHTTPTTIKNEYKQLIEDKIHGGMKSPRKTCFPSSLLSRRVHLLVKLS